jgi:hypothetical protein
MVGFTLPLKIQHRAYLIENIYPIELEIKETTDTDVCFIP